jgi:transcriptional regulator with XRE-family HTH domain
MAKPKKELNVQIGERIRGAREDARLTQEKMAEIVDVSVQYISDLERGIVGASVPTMIRICRCLNVSCDYILMGQENDDEIFALIGSERIRRLSPQHQQLIGRMMNLMLDALTGNSQDSKE